MMELECFLNAIGMGNSMNAQIFSSLDQQIVDFAVHSIHWQWKSSCKNLCDIHITLCSEIEFIDASNYHKNVTYDWKWIFENL